MLCLTLPENDLNFVSQKLVKNAKNAISRASEHLVFMSLYNPGDNILRLFDDSPIFVFTIGETKSDN